MTIGVIGAMQMEVDDLKAQMTDTQTEVYSEMCRRDRCYLKLFIPRGQAHGYRREEPSTSCGREEGALH